MVATLKGLAALAAVVAVAQADKKFTETMNEYNKDNNKKTIDDVKPFVTPLDSFKHRPTGKFWPRNHDKFAEVAKLITAEHIPMLNATKSQDDAAAIQGTMSAEVASRCNIMFKGKKDLVKPLRKEFIANLKWSCLEEFVADLTIEQFEHVSLATFKDGMEVIVNTISKNEKIFEVLTAEHIRAMAASKLGEELWSKLNVAALNKVTKNLKKKCAEFTPVMWSKMTGHETALNKKVVDALPASIYAKVKTVIAAETLKSLDKKKLSAFASARKGENQCSNLEITALNAKNLSAVSPACFAHVLATRYTKESPLKFETAKDISKLSDDAFSAITDADTLEHIDPEALVFLRAPHLADIVKSNAAALKRIPESAADNKSFLSAIRPTPKAFAKLDPKIQTELLAKRMADLPTDILAYVDNENADKWSHEKGSGLSFLEGIKADKAVLAHLGSKLTFGEVHPCDLVQADMSESMPHFKKNMGASCYANLTVLGEMSDADRLSFPPTVYALSSLADIRKNAASLLTTVDAATFAVMVNGPNYCAQADAEAVFSVPAASFASMSAKCLSGMKPEAVSAITSAQMAALPLETVREVDAVMAARMPSVAAFNPAQLKALSENVKEKPTAWTVVKADAVAAFSVEQVASLSAKSLGAIPAASFKAITKTQVKALPAASLASVSFEQAKELSEDALLAMVPEQIRAFGSAITDKTRSPLKVFTPEIVAKMSKECAEEVAAASKAAGVSAATNNAVSIKASVAGALAALAAALALF